MEKENYINRVLESGKYLKNLEVSNHVWTRIQGQISPQEQISKFKLSLISFGVLVLLMVNVVSMVQSQATMSNNSNPVAQTDMFSSSANSIYF